MHLSARKFYRLEQCRDPITEAQPFTGKRLFCSLFIFVGPQYGGLCHWLVATSRLTCFIPRAHAGNCISRTQCKEKLDREVGQDEDEWCGKVEIGTVDFLAACEA